MPERLIDSIERRVGLLDRQLDEDEPAQLRDPGVGGQHLAPLRVARFLQFVAFGRVACRLDLRQAR